MEMKGEYLMTNDRMNPKVDEFISRATKWQDEYKKLRTIVLDCGLTEELKWGVPCYTDGKSNIALIHGFKEYCAILFVKGSLMKDPHGILIQQTENVQAARQIRFTKTQEIVDLEPILKAYINEAVEIEKAGLEVDFKKNKEFTLPEELKDKFYSNPALKTSFEALTPGRQKAYVLYFSQPKNSNTRESRIEKFIEKILDGKGLDD
jgi:uncharacterized protein YdeI (YjbR/CyaY-like superfamily)